MKAIELRSKTINELRDSLNELRKESFNLRIQHSANQLENTDRIKIVRREIARVKTIIGEKNRAASSK